MEYAEAISIVSELFRISQWSGNEYGENYAVLDNDIEIRVFQESVDVLIIQGMFADPMPGQAVANSNELKLRYLLQANFIRLIHNNDVLSIDGRTDRLTTSRHINIRDISEESLLANIESFIQNLDFWDVTAKRKQSFVSMSPLLSLFRKR